MRPGSSRGLDTRTGESTAYRYDELGNLLGVALPDGRPIQYRDDQVGHVRERAHDGCAR
jgi:YD repeat-containing protein